LTPPLVNPEGEDLRFEHRSRLDGDRPAAAVGDDGLDDIPAEAHPLRVGRVCREKVRTQVELRAEPI
jgi:hypothetical protein